ncbi:MAG: nitrous oxide-stimulated promoter family protein [Erysipelotrichaceae bacterium]|nr:nitrous oxide-stimulated promoter family protein [Erysipelotrichaceae bacterium]
MELEAKRQKEKEVIDVMIRLYCKRHHQQPCEACEELKRYAYERINKCPFMETKSFCSNCKVHCYKKDMREEMKRVMRYSGPWMLLYHPILAIRHLILSYKERS